MIRLFSTLFEMRILRGFHSVIEDHHVDVPDASFPPQMLLPKSIVYFLLLLTTLQHATAIPIPNSTLHDKAQLNAILKNELNPPSKWKAIAPILGAGGIVLFLGGLVFIGTRLDETHKLALATHKRQKFEALLNQESKKSLPESVTGEELKEIQNIINSGNKELEKEIARHAERKMEVHQNTWLQFDETIDKVLENHKKKNGKV